MAATAQLAAQFSERQSQRPLSQRSITDEVPNEALSHGERARAVLSPAVRAALSRKYAGKEPEYQSLCLWLDSLESQIAALAAVRPGVPLALVDVSVPFSDEERRKDSLTPLYQSRSFVHVRLGEMQSRARVVKGGRVLEVSAADATRGRYSLWVFAALVRDGQLVEEVGNAFINVADTLADAQTAVEDDESHVTVTLQACGDRADHTLEGCTLVLLVGLRLRGEPADRALVVWNPVVVDLVEEPPLVILRRPVDSTL